MNDLMQYYMKNYGQKINEYLNEISDDNIAIEPVLAKAMAYSLNAGGKRLRPILLMAGADILGENGLDYIKTASALEFIHTYSLIHDDLPAMDDDDYRRGKLTNHKVYGEGMAILAGDALLTMAFDMIANDENIPAARRLAVIKEISKAAGAKGMVGGQAMDLEGENKNLSLAELKAMHGAKTGALFVAALRSGAIIAGADEEALAKLTEYAEAFGLAFQITDDILDMVGDEAVIGKPVGSDEKNHKSTYVTLTSLEEAKGLAEKAVNKGLKAIESFGEKGEFLRELINYLIIRDK